MAEYEDTLVDPFELDGTDVDLGLQTVWTQLVRGGFRRSPRLEGRVRDAIPLGRSLIEPRGIGHLVSARSLPDAETEALPTPIRNADVFCFGLCTVGRAVDDYTRALSKQSRLIDSMILDAVAITALSQLSDRLARAAFHWAEERGLSASRAFSPGAGSSDWTLENQRFVFAHLPGRPLGVRLTPHLLMRPSKSVSFVIGIGERVAQASRPFSCAGCPRFDCSYRHVPEETSPPCEPR